MNIKSNVKPRTAYWTSCVLLAAMVLPVTAHARGAEQTLYSFGCYIDGCFPLAGLVADTAGALYGTTDFGGVNNIGTVFRLAPDEHGHYDSSVIYTFAGGVDGGYPDSVPIFDQQGNLYATSATAGPGSVIELKPKKSGEWKLRRAYQFGGNGVSDGDTPLAGVVRDAQGDLFGTTSGGGKYGAGTIYELSPTGKGWREAMRYDLNGQSEGYTLHAGVIQDSGGNLYGATAFGGEFGHGVIFQLSPGDLGWKFTVLHAIDPNVDGSDPESTLVFGEHGRLYGSTVGGGGSVFELRPPTGSSKRWSFQTLYRFTGGADGAYPYSTLYVARDGALYGTTSVGGIQTPACAQGCGTVYKLTRSHRDGKAVWAESVLWRFTGGPDGSEPLGALAPCGPRQVCGTAYSGGAFNSGTVFKITE